VRVDDLTQMLQYDPFAKNVKAQHQRGQSWRVDARVIEGGLVLFPRAALTPAVYFDRGPTAISQSGV